MKRFKTGEEIFEQYKRMLIAAFPRITIYGDNTWNWHKVYMHDPYTDERFLRIHRAFKRACDYYESVDRHRFVYGY